MSVATEYQKRSITVPREVLEEADRVRPKGSFSAYVADALRQQIRRDKLRRLVDELEAQAGPVSPAELEQATHELLA
jgi:hypothetical protein